MATNKLKANLEKINYYAFLLLAFSLNFPQTIVKFTLGFWLLTCLFSIDWNQRKILNKRHYIPLLLLSFLIIGRVIISFVHADFLSLISKLFDTQLALLLIPVFLVLYVNRYFNLNQILLTYIIGCFLSSLFVVVYFYLYRYGIFIGNVEGIPLATNIHRLTDDIPLFQLFVTPFFKHRAAIGVNISLSIAAIIYLIQQSKKTSYLIIFGWVSISMILLFILYATGSRSGFISVLFVVFSSAVYLFKRKKVIFICFIIIGLLIAGLSGLKTTRLIDRGSKNYQNDVSKMDPRFPIWKSAIEIIEVNPWLGVGYSNVKPKLYGKYKENGQTMDIAAEHNSHNQFLQFSLESGIWASIVFALILLPVYFEKRIFYLSLAFSSTFTIYSIFEDTLIIINGVSIFVFFIALLILSQKHFLRQTAI